MDKELLYYLFSSVDSIGKIVSSGFKVSYLDTENLGFSAIRSLYTIGVDCYLRLRILLNLGELQEHLKYKPFSLDEKKSILLLFEEISTKPPEKELSFLIATIKQNYVSKILSTSLASGSESLMRSDLPTALKKIKEAVYSSENVLNESSISGELRDSISQRIKDYSDVKNNLVKPGIITGFPTIDRCSGGMKPGELITLMGGTAEGKSIMLLNIGHYVHMELKKNVLHISLENAKHQVERRYDSCDSGLSYTKLREGRLDKPVEEDMYKKSLYSQRDNKAVFYIWDQPTCSPNQIAAKLTELSSKYTFDLVVVDYVSLLKSDRPRKESGWQELSDITNDLHILARTYNVPVITAAQVTRKGMQSKKTYYSHTDVGFAHTIIHNSDTVVSFRVKNPDILKTGLGICELSASIEKCRDGAVGTFMMDADFDRMRMVERTFS